MIACLAGIIQLSRPEQVVVLVNGVGFLVFVSLNTFYDLPPEGREVQLLVHTIVREDAFQLYGFSAEVERQAFIQLIGITGVGPKLALSILSGINPEQLWMAVKNRDPQRLTKVPGIGAKTAARLIVELESKVPDLQGSVLPLTSVNEDALSALKNLGYSGSIANKALEKAASQLGPEPVLEELLRLAFKILSEVK